MCAYRIVVVMAAVDRRFKFNKCSQLFIGMHNQVLTVAMRVNSEDCSPARIHG
jgi:hypothetical protein